MCSKSSLSQYVVQSCLRMFTTGPQTALMQKPGSPKERSTGFCLARPAGAGGGGAGRVWWVGGGQEGASLGGRGGGPPRRSCCCRPRPRRRRTPRRAPRAGAGRRGGGGAGAWARVPRILGGDWGIGPRGGYG